MRFPSFRPNNWYVCLVFYLFIHVYLTLWTKVLNIKMTTTALKLEKYEGSRSHREHWQRGLYSEGYVFYGIELEVRSLAKEPELGT